MEILEQLQAMSQALQTLQGSIGDLQSASDAKDKEIADLKAGDSTPYSQDDMDKVNAHVADVQSQLDKVSSDDEADKKAIADAGQKLEDLKSAIEAVLHPAAPAPVEPAPVEPEAPVEEKPVDEQPAQ